ncbi:hypothetical protein M514_21757 [Trichuris suis]|uniref:Ionotropic glutamate receptor L-glutamate and glycine-binding domain-containing protein n=1 Tax=Trichuris suis TaxID=68888 RepID=A0A085N9D5_9BILA|nr:hypothetical protein M514_21757 [Trichuris suis]
MKEIDSIIKWCKQEDLDTDLFRMGRELEISFYYRIFSVVAAKHSSPNTNVRLSALVTHCLSDAQENSTQLAITDLVDIHLNIYHIFAAPPDKEIYLGAPFIQIDQDKSGSRRYTGYCMDLIKTISEQLSFTYEVYDVPLVQYKRLYFSKAVKGSKIYGIVPELHEGNANIALANIHPTSAGELLVDFTIPFYEDVGLAALIKTSKDPNALWQFLLIIEWPVALCTVLSVLISSAMLTLFDIFSPFSWHNRKNCEIKETERKRLLMKENLWFCMMSFTLQGAGENPRNLSGRIVVAAYWICLFLLTGTYSAVLANRLTARSFLQELDDVEQLFDQNRIQYSVVEGSSTMKYFQRLAEVEKALVE